LQPSRSKKINLILFGGLGNQLFQYYAGQYLAHKSHAILRIDSTFSQLGRSGHFDWINELTLPGMISPSAPKYSLPLIRSYMKRRVRDSLAKLISNREWQLKFLRQYQSHVIGYDPNLADLIPPITLVGNFQTWRYYKDLKDKGLAPDVRMKTPSSWFLETEDKLAHQGKVLGIHVRRGDYVGNSDIGTLSVRYYETAIKELKSRRVTWDAVWIFTDDVQFTQKEFRGSSVIERNTVFIEPPSDSHSFESLLLMSKSSSLVIANSTYSWWAATLGNTDKITVCPAKWFVKMEDPQELYPNSWIQIPSSWISY